MGAKWQPSASAEEGRQYTWICCTYLVVYADSPGWLSPQLSQSLPETPSGYLC